NYVVHELGDIDIPRPDVGKNLVTEVNILRNLHEVAITNERLAKKVAQQVELGRFPLVLGGDHSIAIGTLAGVSHHYENLGLIWYDAHGDINTEETTPSGNIHGMPLAISLGLGHERLTSIMKANPKVKPEHIVLIGIRDLDDGEKELLKRL